MFEFTPTGSQAKKIYCRGFTGGVPGEKRTTRAREGATNGGVAARTEIKQIIVGTTHVGNREGRHVTTTGKAPIGRPAHASAGPDESKLLSYK